jgi:hypothetical protein
VAALDRDRRVVLAAVLVAAALPLVHVAVAVTRIVRRGDLIYGAEVHSSGIHLVIEALSAMTANLGSPIGWVLLAAVGAGIAGSAFRGRVDWAQIGLVLTGLATLAWSAQTAVFPSRYYIPLIALLAVAFSLTLASTPSVVRLAGIVLACAFALKASGNAHGYVVRWADEQERSVELVKSVARLRATGCPVVAGGLGAEMSVSLPVLVSLRHPGSGSCVSGRLFLVRGPLPLDSALERVCRSGSTRTVFDESGFRVVACRPSPSADALVARRRLR